MINNLNKIKPLLDFSDPDNFYWLSIMQRKKDMEKPENHQSIRMIKTYSISSMEYLDKKWNEIKNLSEIFKARIYINVNPTSHKKVTLQMLKDLAVRVADENWDTSRLHEYSMGKAVSNGEIWVVDIDSKDMDYITAVRSTIDECDPVSDKTKLIKIIQTKNGFHLLTSKFNVQQLAENYPEVTVCKCNPTLLYYPDTLNSSKIC